MSLGGRVSGFIENALSTLRAKLLDLTRRNRLLNFKESARSIRIVDELPDEVYRILVSDDKEMQFIPVDGEEAALDAVESEDPLLLDEAEQNNGADLKHELPTPNKSETAKKHVDTKLQTPFTSTVLERRCKKLLQESKTAIDETGSNLLYLAIGFLEWYDSDDSSEMCRAPLMLLPVKIEKGRLDPNTNCYMYCLSYTGEDIETNLSLAEKLNRDFGIVLPILDAEAPEEYFTSVAKITIKRKRWRVAREMVLGLFSFSKLLMYRDLDPSRWPEGATILDNNNVCQVLGGCREESDGDASDFGEEYDIDHDSNAVALPVVLDADSSQTSVIVDAVCKKANLVVEGPPGTGKSQTITNLIAAALHEGMSVLFVAEKKAALEVVRSRLNHVGLGDFCLELHSHKTQKGQLHADIGRRLKKEYRDAATLERELDDLAQERERLISYSRLINQTLQPDNETIYDVFWLTERFRAELKSEPLNFRVNKALSLTRNALNKRVNLLQDMARIRKDLPDEEIQAWEHFAPANLLPGDDANIVEILRNTLVAIDSMMQSIESVAACGCPIQPHALKLYKMLKINVNLFTTVPEEFLQQLAPALIIPKNSGETKKLGKSIIEWRKLSNAAGLIPESLDDVALEQVNILSDATKRIEAMKFGDRTPTDIAILTGLMTQAFELFNQLVTVRTSVDHYLVFPPRTIDEFNCIITLSSLLAAAPDGVLTSAHPEHVAEATRHTLDEARRACDLLVHKLEKHGQTFTLRHLPPCSELAALAHELRGYRGSFVAFLSPNYWKLRRRVKSILVDQKQVGEPDIIERIEELIDTLEAIDAVNSNETYCRRLGKMYAGIKTLWEPLEDCVAWGQLLTDITSFAKAQTIISSVAEIAPQMALAAGAAEKIFAELNQLTPQLELQTDDNINDIVSKLVYKRDNLVECLQPLLASQKLSSLPVSTIAAAARSYIAAEAIVTKIHASENDLKPILGDFYNGVHTDIETLSRTQDWLDRFQHDANLPPELFAWFTEKDTPQRCQQIIDIVVAIDSFWGDCKQFVTDISRFGDLSSKSLFRKLSTTNFQINDLKNTLDNYLGHTTYLLIWSDYRRLTTEAKELGLDEFIDAIDSGKITASECADIYRHAVYDSQVRELISRHKELASFTRASYESSRERFAQLDKQILTRTCDRISYRVSGRHIPRGVNFGPVKNHTDLALLEHEIQKQKRHIPIRQLVLRSGLALRALKPIFMMSPLSVAQYLGPHHPPFDLVIMDEASQLKPEDALGAIARARQAVIVGDSNQLPPSSFFDRNDSAPEDDDGNTAAIQESESILDICLTTFNKRRLRWHYRSEHESLIAFSNNRFYDDDLIIFPSPKGRSANYGVQRHYVEGATYLKGRNKTEAEAVVAEVIEHFQKTPRLTLGVATFNREQAELILDILERKQKELPWLERAIRETEAEEEPFFVKNLENVQGDERDVIFVSTTYGPDPTTGRVFQRFGPIAGELGWRRLNVIFTRAKKRLLLFTSMTSQDIKLSDTPSRGVRSLKEYLAYAETGILPDYGVAESGKEPDSDFEVAVAHHLQIHGFRTKAQIGVAGFFIDIGVLLPDSDNEFILGIECDGATYHSAKSTRDRDRLRQEILEKKGWRIHRIWSTDWFKNRDREVKRLLEAVKSANEAYKAENPKIEKASTVKTTTNKPAKAVSAAAPTQTERGLKEELLEYRQANIMPQHPEMTRCILRDEMIEKFSQFMPLSKDDFLKVIPIGLRQNTDGAQLQYLDDIFEIIDGYV